MPNALLKDMSDKKYSVSLFDCSHNFLVCDILIRNTTVNLQFLGAN